MSKKTSVYAYVGVWLIALPLLGLPASWKAFLTFLTGIALLAFEVKGKRASTVREDNTEPDGASREAAPPDSVQR